MPPTNFAYRQRMIDRLRQGPGAHLKNVLPLGLYSARAPHGGLVMKGSTAGSRIAKHMVAFAA